MAGAATSWSLGWLPFNLAGMTGPAVKTPLVVFSVFVFYKQDITNELLRCWQVDFARLALSPVSSLHAKLSYLLAGSSFIFTVKTSEGYRSSHLTLSIKANKHIQAFRSNVFVGPLHMRPLNTQSPFPPSTTPLSKNIKIPRSPKLTKPNQQQIFFFWSYSSTANISTGPENK